MNVSDPNRDPLGKRALFSGSDSSSVAQAASIEPRAKSQRANGNGSNKRDGVKALYSLDTEPRLGTVVIECSDCLEHTRISLLDAGVRMWSFSLWIPGKRFSRHLSCPACGRRTWCRIRWTD